jgi:hypothetical protein
MLINRAAAVQTTLPDTHDWRDMRRGVSPRRQVASIAWNGT